MTLLPTALAAALTEPGCFVDSHRTPDGAWAHRAVYTGADAPAAAELAVDGPDEMTVRYADPQAAPDPIAAAVRFLRERDEPVYADAVAHLARHARKLTEETERLADLAAGVAAETLAMLGERGAGR